jgi:histone-binding protein RBBP4
MVANEMALAEKEIVEDHQLKEKIVNEEFKIWKKTVPLLYDTIRTWVLDSPSLAFTWLPQYDYSEDKNTIAVKFLIGTNTSCKSQNYLKLASVDIPSTLAPDFSTVRPNVDSIPIPTSNAESPCNFNVISTWKQPREINKMKLSPNSENVIAMDGDGIIHMFNLKSQDQTDYKYHKLEGSTIEWVNDSSFLSGATDTQIALWDITKPSTPIHLFKTHAGPINDLSTNMVHSDIFGSVSDDYTTQFHDLRMAATDANPAIKFTNSQIQNAIVFHPDVDTLYATGGKDNIVSLYDMRKYSVPIREFYGHNDTVIGLKWDSNNDPFNLISWGLDKRVITWDLNLLNEEFTYPVAENETSKRRSTNKVDPCLKFVHAGHTTRINDTDIHPTSANLYATVGDDNLVEVWKPKTLATEEESESEESAKEEPSKEDEDVEMKL